MTQPRVTPPEPVELVSATEAAVLIQEADRELAALERRAQESRATAEAVEARAEQEGADERTSTWAIVRLQRFIDGLRAEAERDAETVVEAARRGARERSEEQRADDARMRHLLLPVVRPAPPAEIVDPPMPAPEPVAAVAPLVAAPVEHAAVEPAPPAAAPTPASEPQDPVVQPVPETSVSWASMATPVPPATNGHAPAISAPAVEAPPVVAPPVVVAAPGEPPPRVDPAPAPVAAIAGTPARKKRFLRGFPISAVLEVLAVLLVLLFILLRLS